VLAVTVKVRSRATCRVGPTRRRSASRCGRWLFQTTHSSPPGRSTRAAPANKRSAAVSETVVPEWNGGLQTTRSTLPAGRLAAASSRTTRTWPDRPFASTVAAAEATATAAANGLTDRVRVVRDDAAASLPDGSVDLVVCNPPFHAGVAVSETLAHRLFAGAARVLRPGGELWCVYNSHLPHRDALRRIVGPTRQVSRDPAFTVTASTRR